MPAVEAAVKVEVATKVEAAAKVEAVAKAKVATRLAAAAKVKVATRLAAAKNRTAIRREATVKAMTPVRAKTARPLDQVAKVKAPSDRELFAQGMSNLALTDGQQYNVSRQHQRCPTLVRHTGQPARECCYFTVASRLHGIQS